MTPTNEKPYSTRCSLNPQGLTSSPNAVLEFNQELSSSQDLAFTLIASIPFDAEDPHPKWDLLYAVDWFFSLSLFLCTLPVSVLAALWVIAVDPGNPFYTQQRSGMNLKPYTIFKIRTMRGNGDQTKFCDEDDGRIIPGGHFLRKTRIDELPQLLNVVFGDMALIGPRPEQIPFVQEFLRTIPDYRRRFSVKPGITGLAQVCQGYVACEDGTREKLKYDLRFIQNRSPRLWVTIACKTLCVIITRHGAR